MATFGTSSVSLGVMLGKRQSSSLPQMSLGWDHGRSTTTVQRAALALLSLCLAQSSHSVGTSLCLSADW